MTIFSAQESQFQWTNKKAKGFLESQNKLFCGDNYSEDRMIDFDSPISPEFQVNTILGNVLFSVKVYQISSEYGVGMASIFDRHGHPEGKNIHANGSDIDVNISDANLEIAARIISAAQFLDIDINDRHKLGVSPKP